MKRCPKCGLTWDDMRLAVCDCGYSFAAEESNPALPQPVVAANRSDSARLQDLSSRVSQLEARLPITNLLNDSFWPRAFAVLGHHMAATLVLYAVVFAVVSALFMIGAFITN